MEDIEKKLKQVEAEVANLKEKGELTEEEYQNIISGNLDKIQEGDDDDDGEWEDIDEDADEEGEEEENKQGNEAKGTSRDEMDI